MGTSIPKKGTNLCEKKALGSSSEIYKQGLFQKVRACVWFFRKKAKKGKKNVEKGQNV